LSIPLAPFISAFRVSDPIIHRRGVLCEVNASCQHGRARFFPRWAKILSAHTRERQFAQAARSLAPAQAFEPAIIAPRAARYTIARARFYIWIEQRLRACDECRNFVRRID
jgi:hypothetical protein